MDMEKYSDIVMNNFRIYENINSIPIELENIITSYLSINDQVKFLTSIDGHFTKLRQKIKTPIKIPIKNEQKVSHFSESNNKDTRYYKKNQRKKKTNIKKLFKIKRNIDHKFLQIVDENTICKKINKNEYAKIEHTFDKNIIYENTEFEYDGTDEYGPIIDCCTKYIVIENKYEYIFLVYKLYEKNYYFYIPEEFMLFCSIKLDKNMYDHEYVKQIKNKYGHILTKFYCEGVKEIIKKFT